MLLGASVLPAGSSGSMCELTVYRYEPVRTYNAASFFFVLGPSRGGRQGTAEDRQHLALPLPRERRRLHITT